MGGRGMHFSVPGQEKMAYNSKCGDKISGFIRFLKFREKSKTFRFSKITLFNYFSLLDFLLLASCVRSFVR